MSKPTIKAAAWMCACRTDLRTAESSRARLGICLNCSADGETLTMVNMPLFTRDDLERVAEAIAAVCGHSGAKARDTARRNVARMLGEVPR